jgi:hypothetical protein
MVILHFVDPDSLIQHRGEIIIKNKSENKDKDEPLGDYVHKGENGLPTITIFKEKNAIDIELILSLAHEFRHMWQHNFCSFLWDAKNAKIAKRAKEMEEEDAHGYDLEMMKIWDKNEWNWKTLPDYKKKYLTGLMRCDGQMVEGVSKIGSNRRR